jgi:hypothetical protein
MNLFQHGDDALLTKLSPSAVARSLRVEHVLFVTRAIRQTGPLSILVYLSMRNESVRYAKIERVKSN